MSATIDQWKIKDDLFNDLCAELEVAQAIEAGLIGLRDAPNLRGGLLTVAIRHSEALEHIKHRLSDLNKEARS